MDGSTSKSENPSADEESMSAIRENFATILGMTVQKLGPMPNEAGDLVRKAFNSGDLLEIVSVGCVLEVCLKRNSYEYLNKLLVK